MLTFDGDENEPACVGGHAGVILPKQVHLRRRGEAVVGGDGGERLAVPERVGEEEPVGRGDPRVPAGAVDGDVHPDAGVGDVVGGVRVGAGEPAGGGEVAEVAGDALVGLAAADQVGEGAGEVGGGGRAGERVAAAGEGDVDAGVGGDEVQVGVLRVVGRQRAVVDAEELGDVGEVLVPGDEEGGEREVAAGAAAAPRRRRRRGEEEEGAREEGGQRHGDGEAEAEEEEDGGIP
jgi:hypothetical protein